MVPRYEAHTLSICLSFIFIYFPTSYLSYYILNSSPHFATQVSKAEEREDGESVKRYKDVHVEIKIKIQGHESWQ